MCFNKETSLIAFGIGFSFSIYLIHYGLKNKDTFKLCIGILSSFIVIIQLFEYFIWANLHNKQINGLFSYLSQVETDLQPLIFASLLYYFYKPTFPLYFIILLGIRAVLTLLRYIPWTLDKYSIVGTSGRLIWPAYPIHNFLIKNSIMEYLSIILYCVIITLTAIMFINQEPRFLHIGQYILITAIGALVYGLKVKPRTMSTVNAVFSTLWCFMGIMVPIIGTIV